MMFQDQLLSVIERHLKANKITCGKSAHRDLTLWVYVPDINRPYIEVSIVEDMVNVYIKDRNGSMTSIGRASFPLSDPSSLDKLIKFIT